MTHVLVVPEAGLDTLVDSLRGVDGLAVTVAETVAEARDRLAGEAFDGVVVGSDLPDGDGVSLLADVAGGSLPAVMVTADGEGQVASDALAAGASDYVQVTPAAVDETTVERVLAGLGGAVGDDKGDSGGRDRALEEYETILETIPVGVFVLDENAEILRVNRKATELVGLDRETVLSMSVPDLVTDDIFGEDAIDPYVDLVPELLSSESAVTEGSFQFTARPDDEERIFEATVTLRPTDGEFRGCIGVFRDITEQLRRQERLETQRAQLAERTTQLERQNERLDEFASVISHELRNPLNMAQGHLKLGRRNDDDEYFETVADALDRMESMIDDILTLTHQGKTVTETDPVVLAEMADQCWDLVETADATLDVTVEGEILADATRLRQLFENLFANAVEHAGEDATVTVGPIPEDGAADAPLAGFYVADDGPGIPAEDREDVFEKGFTTAADGTGFGLAIVASVAEAHGWSVTATESEFGDPERGEPPGARFEITDVATPSQSSADEQ